MRHLFFELINMVNDQTLAFLIRVEVSDIEQAMKLHNLRLEDIGIFTRELE